jgi:hypothetical protein
MTEPRSACRACESADLVAAVDFGLLPVTDTSPDFAAPAQRHPLQLSLCLKCALLQLRHGLTVGAPETLATPRFSALRPRERRSLERLAGARIASRQLGTESLVLEIGSSDGRRLLPYAQRGVRVLGVERCEARAAVARGAGVPTLHARFDTTSAETLVRSGIQPDLILLGRALALSPDPGEMLRGLARLALAAGSNVVIEVPYVVDLIESGALDRVDHEQHGYFSLTTLTRLLPSLGLWVTDAERSGPTLCAHVGPRQHSSPAVRELLLDETVLGVARAPYYEAFGRRAQQSCDRLRRLLCELAQRGARVAAYGAGPSAARLLNRAGIGRHLLGWVADPSPARQGRSVPGAQVPVVHPEQILLDLPDYLLLLPGTSPLDVAEEQAEYRRHGGKLIVPLPALEIV